MNDKQVGPHRVVRERLDAATIHFGANIEEQEMVEILDTLAAMMDEEPFVLLLDFSKVDTLSASVRRIVGEKTQTMNIIGFGMFGANFHMKVIAKLVNSAISLFKKKSIPQEFFDDYESAKKWGMSVRDTVTGSAP